MAEIISLITNTVENTLEKLSDLKLKILYYCKSGKTLSEISRCFEKSYWYISHLLSELRFERLINTIKKGRMAIFTTPLDIIINVESEMKRRY